MVLKQAGHLTVGSVRLLTKPGRHSDGANLYLQVDKSGARRWVFLYRTGTRLREMGLGSPDPKTKDRSAISLGQARDLAKAARDLIAAGVDPIDRKRQGGAAAPSAPTFAEFAKSYVETMAPGWRNPKHLQQWRTTLGIDEPDAKKLRIDAKAQRGHLDALKSLRDLHLDMIETKHIISVLTPIWQVKADTAARLRGRLESILSAAIASGLRLGPNPAQWRGHLDALLPRQKKLVRGHHAAMAYEELPAFMGALRRQEGQGPRALEFTILAAARSGEVLGATWGEIDFDKRLWIVPAGRMKGGRLHRVPLPTRAIELLRDQYEGRFDDGPDTYIFPGGVRGKPLSSMALAMTLRRMNLTGVTVHGFRSSFRDWVGEETSFAREVAEAALAHVVGDETERAYRRGDALEKRSKLMSAWAAFCEPPKDTNKVPASALAA